MLPRESILCRVVLISFLLCTAIGICSAKKLSLNKPYPHTKYSTITFKKGDTCIIADVVSTSVLKWRYSHDTIIVKSIYNRNRIDRIKYNVINKEMDKLIVQVNNASKLTVVHLLDENHNEMKNVVLTFSNEVKYDPRFRFFSVQIHKGLSEPLLLEGINKGAVLNISLDYPEKADAYPYELYEKYVMSGKKLVKVR